MVRFVKGQIICRLTNNLSFCQFPRTVGDELVFHQPVLCASGSAHVTNGGSGWDDVHCRTGVALPTGFPGQVSRSKFSERKVM